MSADAEAEGVAHDQLPETGVRNRKQYSRSIHRQDPDAGEVLPACNEAGRGDEFKECTPSSLLPFGRWQLCTHEECFGDDLDRGDGVVTDGGQCADVSERKRAERFWSRYDLPFEHDTCIKVRRPGLLRGSSGTGHAADTVVHLHVVEPFTEGRLSRTADSFLCENDSFVPTNGREERHVEDGSQYVPAVTCETCLQRMERWKAQPVDTDGGER